MKVEFTGDKGCYFVDSTDSTTRHKVDILALRGKDMRCNGQCSCRDFETRCSPEWTKSGTIVERDEPNYTRCKHITAMALGLQPNSLGLYAPRFGVHGHAGLSNTGLGTWLAAPTKGRTSSRSGSFYALSATSGSWVRTLKCITRSSAASLKHLTT